MTTKEKRAVQDAAEAPIDPRWIHAVRLENRTTIPALRMTQRVRTAKNGSGRATLVLTVEEVPHAEAL